MRFLTLAAPVLLSFGLGGCSLIPDFERPDPPIAAAYPDGEAYRTASAKSADAVSADRVGWRDVFSDPRLQRLIEIALRDNRDLRVAVLNIGVAQAQYRVQRADLFPSITATANAEYQGLPDSTIIPSPQGGGSSSQSAASTANLIQTPTKGSTFRYFTAGLGFTSYELDVFGRIRSQAEQSLEQAFSQAETRRSTQISLIAQVASTYLTLLGDRELLRVSRETLDSQLRSYEITRAMAAGGVTTLLSLRQVETSVDQARANIAQYVRQAAQDENALALLIGKPLPSDLPPGRPLDKPGLLADLPAGLPSALITQRPDILAAERTLRAANASIGAARAAFFPNITLTASDGVASNQLSRLFTGGATTWTFAPTLTIPIFTWGRNQGNLDAAKLQKEIEIANYEKAIQTAFREVADALAARATYRDQIRAQETLVAAAADSYRLAEMRFRAGVDNYINTLDSQRTLYSAQQGLISLRVAEQTNLATFYKALGGGWNENTVVADR